MTHAKQLVGLSAALILVAWTAGTSLVAVPAAAKSKPAEARIVKHTLVQTINGTVSAVKPGTKTVEVTVPWGTADRLIPGAGVTEIREGKSSMRLADLKTGEHVRMTFAEDLRSRHAAKPIIIPLEQHRG